MAIELRDRDEEFSVFASVFGGAILSLRAAFAQEGLTDRTLDEFDTTRSLAGVDPEANLAMSIDALGRRYAQRHTSP
jgi:hypothetical protein